MDYVASRRLLLEQKGFALSNTSGTSMRPLIWGGEHCVAVAPLEGEPRVGDLLLFKDRAAGKNIVHRLVATGEEGGERIYMTRGDNCLGVERVTRREIIGRVAEVHRLSGFRPWHVIPSRQFSVTGRAFRVYSRVWAALWPARRVCYILRAYVYGALGRLKRGFRSG